MNRRQWIRTADTISPERPVASAYTLVVIVDTHERRRGIQRRVDAADPFGVDDGVDPDGQRNTESDDDLSGCRMAREQDQADGHDHHSDHSDRLEAVAEQEDPTDARKQGAATAGDGVGQREVADAVGLGQEEAVRQVDKA